MGLCNSQNKGDYEKAVSYGVWYFYFSMDIFVNLQTKRNYGNGFMKFLGITRNQLYCKVPWVRIPPSLPVVISRFRVACAEPFLLRKNR